MHNREEAASGICTGREQGTLSSMLRDRTGVQRAEKTEVVDMIIVVSDVRLLVIFTQREVEVQAADFEKPTGAQNLHEARR